MLRTCFRWVGPALLAVFPLAVLAQDPGFGPPQDRQWNTPGGVLKLRAWPWEKAPADHKLDSWLQEHKDLVVPGEKFRAWGGKVNRNDELFEDIPFLARDLRRRRGRSQFSLLFACTHKNEFVRLVDIYGPLSIMKTEKESFWSLAEKQVAEWCDEDPDDARQQALLNATRTPPGDGIQLDEIETVIATQQEEYDSFYHLYVTVYVLLKNGHGIQNPRLPVSDLNAARSRELEPDAWFEWRRQGDTYQEKTEDGWRDFTVTYTPEPTASGEKLDGFFEFNDVTGNPWFGSTVINRSYTFRNNGTYASSSSSFYGSGDAMTDTMGSVYMYKHCNESGGSNTFSATGPNTNSEGLFDPAGTPEFVASSHSENPECGDGKAGVYQLDGYTIELQANNGLTKRLPFYRLSDDWIVIDRHWYAK